MSKNAILTICVLVAMFSGGIAKAEIGVGLNGGLAIPYGKNNDSQVLGFDLKLRGGYKLPIPQLDIMIEVVGGLGFLPAELESNPDYNFYQIMIGGRLTFDMIVKPTLFIAIGYGELTGRSDDMVVDHRGLSYLVGASAEYTLISWLDIGLFAALNQISYDKNNSDKTHDWITVGLSLTLFF